MIYIIPLPLHEFHCTLLRVDHQNDSTIPGLAPSPVVIHHHSLPPTSVTLTSSPPPSCTPTPVLLIFFFAAAGTFINSTMMWTLLPYMQSVGYHSITLYIRLSAIPILVPALSYSLLGFLCSRIGAARTMTYTHLLVGLGILLVLALPNYLPALVAGTVLHSVVEGVRIVRIAAISELVSAKKRTAALAVHFLMSPVGAVFGPLAWLVVDRYGVYYSIAIVFMMGVAALAWMSREHLDGERHIVEVSELQQQSETEQSCELGASNNRTAVGYGSVTLPAHDDHTLKHNEKTFSSNKSSEADDEKNAEQRGWTRDDLFVLLWFTCCILPVRVSLCLQMATFQPALIERLNWTADSVASAYLVVAIASTVPPLIVAALSTRMSDRTIAFVGILLKFIGALLYLPLLPTTSSSSGEFALRPWQIVAGFVLAVKAAAFFMPCLQSVLTKRVEGRRRRVEMMGLVWMVSNGTAAIAQILAADVLMSLLGTWRYAVVVLPYSVSGVMVLWGRSWGYVTPRVTEMNGNGHGHGHGQGKETSTSAGKLLHDRRTILGKEGFANFLSLPRKSCVSGKGV